MVARKDTPTDPSALTATYSDSTLCLNSSNDPSIPEEGLVLVPDVPTPVTEAQAAYLRTLNLPATVKGI